MTLMDHTATELADALTVMREFPHNAGGLSQLDEATMGYGSLSPSLAGAHRTFAEARHRHMSSIRSNGGEYSDEAWADAMEAADRLAAELRSLGNYTIPRCGRPDRFGICTLPVADGKACRSTLHTD